jgi:hypothetical protein
MDQERTALSRIGRWVGWLVVLALAAAVAFGTVTVVGQVTERPLTRAAVPPPGASPSAGPTAVPAVATGTTTQPTSAFPGGLPPVASRPVVEVQAALEQLGATVQTIDARGWSRPVVPGWLACHASEAFAGDDVPTGEVTVTAVPAGDPCP